METVFTNPFVRNDPLTSLEKVIKTSSNGIEYIENGKTVTHKKKKDVIIRGVLTVTVISAENLVAADFMGKSDPYAVLIMKKSETKCRTRVSSKNNIPYL